MAARPTVKPDIPAASSLVTAGVQLVNELVRQLQTRMTDTGDATAHASRRIARLKARVRMLEDCVMFLASAVGTCSACFGKVADCPVCRGRGQPGRLTVEPVAFAEIVAPLFEQQPERLSELVRKYGWADPGLLSQIVAPRFDQQPESPQAIDRGVHFHNANGEHRRLDVREGPRNGH